MSKYHYINKFVVFLASAILLFGCAMSPPVQEMSNARQTLQAAREANAARLAPEYMSGAEDLMKQASEALDSGDYLSAKAFAVEAQQQAIKARQKALSLGKNH